MYIYRYVRKESGLNNQAVKAVLLDNLRTLDIVRPRYIGIEHRTRSRGKHCWLVPEPSAMVRGCCMTRHFRPVVCTYAADEEEHEAHEN